MFEGSRFVFVGFELFVGLGRVGNFVREGFVFGMWWDIFLDRFVFLRCYFIWLVIIYFDRLNIYRVFFERRCKVRGFGREVLLVFVF